MSILQYPETINFQDLQIWNNAAFDNGDAEESTAIKSSWCPPQPILVNRSENLESDSSKENHNPAFCQSPLCVTSPIPIKPLNPNGATENLQGKPLKLLFKQGLLLPPPTVSKTGNEVSRDDGNIDTEIEEIEMEISRLASKLKSLRLEKAESNLKTIERRGQVTPAKYMEQKQSLKDSAAPKKIKGTPAVSASTKFRQRGVSLGPSEIILGVRSQQTRKPEMTPIQSTQNRRKSCFWKLQEINEEKVTKQREGERSLSLSPKSRPPVSKIHASKQSFTTMGSKKPVQRDVAVLSSIQPKKLFKEGETLVSTKKPAKTGRIIASRYNQIPIQFTRNLTQTDNRKRSLPENDKDDSKRCDKKRASSVGKSRGLLPESSRNQVRQWEIPNEAMSDLLPKIKTIRCTNESLRDSGPAKRVTELIGRKSYFGAEERDVENSVCQTLNFNEEQD